MFLPLVGVAAAESIWGTSPGMCGSTANPRREAVESKLQPLNVILVIVLAGVVAVAAATDYNL